MCSVKEMKFNFQMNKHVSADYIRIALKVKNNAICILKKIKILKNICYFFIPPLWPNFSQKSPDIVNQTLVINKSFNIQAKNSISQNYPFHTGNFV